MRGAGLRDRAGGEEQAHEDDRDVHQEDGTPAGARDVGGHQDAAQDLSGHHRQAGGRPVQAHGLRAPGTGRGRLDGRQHLRQHRGGRGALRHPCRHQRPGVRRETAGQRGQAEGRHAAQEQAAPAEEVTEPAAQDQQDGVRHPVSGDDEFQDRLVRGEVRADGGQGDVDDEEVDERECRTQQHREESEAAECGWRLRGARTDGT
ncbi:hypothetical protein RKD48_005410 [Streptomyces ambofaciens]